MVRVSLQLGSVELCRGGLVIVESNYSWYSNRVQRGWVWTERQEVRYSQVELVEYSEVGSGQKGRTGRSYPGTVRYSQVQSGRVR